MRVRVVLAIEVDPGNWDQAFGTGTRAKDIVDDVRAYVLTGIQGSPAACDDKAITAAQLTT